MHLSPRALWQPSQCILHLKVRKVFWGQTLCSEGTDWAQFTASGFRTACESSPGSVLSGVFWGREGQEGTPAFSSERGFPVLRLTVTIWGSDAPGRWVRQSHVAGHSQEHLWWLQASLRNPNRCRWDTQPSLSNPWPGCGRGRCLFVQVIFLCKPALVWKTGGSRHKVDKYFLHVMSEQQLPLTMINIQGSTYCSAHGESVSPPVNLQIPPDYHQRIQRTPVPCIRCQLKRSITHLSTFPDQQHHQRTTGETMATAQGIFKPFCIPCQLWRSQGSGRWGSTLLVVYYTPGMLEANPCKYRGSPQATRRGSDVKGCRAHPTSRATCSPALLASAPRRPSRKLAYFVPRKWKQQPFPNHFLK